MQINQTSKTFTRFAIQNDRNNGEKSAYLIVKLLLFQCQTKVYGVKRSSSAWSLTFSWVHADVSYYFNEFVSLLTGCAAIVVIQWVCARCYLWGAEEGEEGGEVIFLLTANGKRAASHVMGIFIWETYLFIFSLTFCTQKDQCVRRAASLAGVRNKNGHRKPKSLSWNLSTHEKTNIIRAEACHFMGSQLHMLKTHFILFAN